MNDDQRRLTFPVLDGEATLPATVVESIGTMRRAQFDPLQIHQEEALTMLLYSRADTWLGWGGAREADRPLRSLARIFLISVGGLPDALIEGMEWPSGSGRSVVIMTVRDHAIIPTFIATLRRHARARLQGV